MRQALHLDINSSPYSASAFQYSHSPESGSPSSSSRPSTDTSPTSSYSDIIYSVLCMHDFHSDDPIHLPFRRNEILDILRMEPTGWWAAMRRGSDSEIVGWIPAAFVKPLSEEMTDLLMNVRAELRIYEYEAEQLYNTAPTSRIPLYGPEAATQTTYKDRKQGYQGGYDTDPQTQRGTWSPRRRAPSPSLPTPLPTPPPRLLPKRNSSYQLNKPTPPTPREAEIPIAAIRHHHSTLTHFGGHLRGSFLCKSLSIPRILPSLLTLPRKGPMGRLNSSREATRLLSTTTAYSCRPTCPGTSNQGTSTNWTRIVDGKVLKGSRRALVEKLIWEPPIRDTVRKCRRSFSSTVPKR
ncbi:hypothetical protein AAF712_006410 [Marasmius tenuissimus]|uniref:SH3 domain-containing protein n=1 Tax=Marasmius tenuissimus TaxID=585030 RepID=A0ABR2ZY08_9AGAR